MINDEFRVPDCPIFHPTPAEWSEDPFGYIRRVIAVGAQGNAGIAKIVPPQGWRVPFALPNRDSFTFTPRVQILNALEATKLGQYPLDLRLLFISVLSHGGYYAVCASNAWPQVYLDLNVPSGRSHRRKSPAGKPSAKSSTAQAVEGDDDEDYESEGSSDGESVKSEGEVDGGAPTLAPTPKDVSTKTKTGSLRKRLPQHLRSHNWKWLNRHYKRWLLAYEQHLFPSLTPPDILRKQQEEEAATKAAEDALKAEQAAARAADSKPVLSQLVVDDDDDDEEQQHVMEEEASEHDESLKTESPVPSSPLFEEDDSEPVEDSDEEWSGGKRTGYKRRRANGDTAVSTGPIRVSCTKNVLVQTPTAVEESAEVAAEADPQPVSDAAPSVEAVEPQVEPAVEASTEVIEQPSVGVDATGPAQPKRRGRRKGQKNKPKVLPPPLPREPRERKAPMRLVDETRFDFDVRATGSRRVAKSKRTRTEDGSRPMFGGDYVLDDGEFEALDGDENNGGIVVIGGRDNLPKVPVNIKRMPLGRKLNLAIKRQGPPEISVGLKFYRYFEAGFALESKVVEVHGAADDDESLEYTILYEDGGTDRVSLGDLQILVANGDTKRQAALAYDKDICQLCLRADEDDKVLLCDHPYCDSGYHMFCLNPPLDTVPEGDWFCPDCVEQYLAGVEERRKDFVKAGYPLAAPSFGFDDGAPQSIKEFAAYANQFKSKFFRGQEASPDDVDKAFWRIVGTPVYDMQFRVEYGSDIDTSVNGSGFPKHVASQFPAGGGPHMSTELATYADHGWNLNNLPLLPGSVLHYIGGSVTGITTPWMYIGMVFSSFCWHQEDHNFYSISYCHWGSPKRWFGIPGSAGPQFEAAVRELAPELFLSSPDLLMQLVTMVSPATLAKKGVPVVTALCEPGEFVITFPKAYHAGYNHGLNCAEAVNFATPDWFPSGVEAEERYRRLRKTPVFSHEGLVLTYSRVTAFDSRESPDSAAQMLPILLSLVEGHRVRIAAAVSAGITKTGPFPLLVQVSSAEDEAAGGKMKMATAAPQGKMATATISLMNDELAVVPAPAVALTRMLGSRGEGDVGVAVKKTASAGALVAALRRWNRERARGKKGASTIVVPVDDDGDVVTEDVGATTSPDRQKKEGISEKHGERTRASTIDEANPLKGARCLDCRQYCYLGMVTCDGCDRELGLHVEESQEAGEATEDVRPLLLTRCVCMYHATSDALGCTHPLSDRRLRLRHSDKLLDDLIAAVKVRAEAPKRWREKSESVLAHARPRVDGVTAPPRPTIDRLQKLMKKATALRLHSSQTAVVEGMLAQAQLWVEQALNVLPRKHNTRKGVRVTVGSPAAEEPAHRLEYLQDLARGSRSLSVLPVKELTDLLATVKAVDHWRAEAQAALGSEFGQDLPAVSPFDAELLASMEAELAAAVVIQPQTVAVDVAVASGQLEPPKPSMDMSKVAVYQSLLARGEALGLALPELDRLKKAIAVLKWYDSFKPYDDAMKANPHTPTSVLVDAIDDAGCLPGADPSLLTVVSPTDTLQLMNATTVFWARPTSVPEPVSMQQWLLASDSLREQLKIGLSQPTLHPGVFRKMLLTLAKFPWSFPDTPKIQKLYARSVEWLNQATALLQQPRCAVPDVVSCISAAAEAKISPDHCPALAALVEIKTACVKWYNAAVDVFATNRLQAAAVSSDPSGEPVLSPSHAKKSAGKDAAVATLMQLLTTVTARMATLTKQVDTAIDAALTDCRRYCVCNQTHADGVLMIACDRCDNWFHPQCVKVSNTTASYVCDACKAKGDVADEPTAAPVLITEDPGVDTPKRPRAKGKRASGGGKIKMHGDEQLYCVCRQPERGREVWVACDYCDNWYHPACVGMTVPEATELLEYRCEACFYRLGLDPQYPTPRVVASALGKRPATKVVEQLLEQAVSSKFAFPEEERLLAEVLRGVVVWERKARALYLPLLQRVLSCEFTSLGSAMENAQPCDEGLFAKIDRNPDALGAVASCVYAEGRLCEVQSPLVTEFRQWVWNNRCAAFLTETTHSGSHRPSYAVVSELSTEMPASKLASEASAGNPFAERLSSLLKDVDVWMAEASKALRTCRAVAEGHKRIDADLPMMLRKCIGDAANLPVTFVARPAESSSTPGGLLATLQATLDALV